MNAVSLEGFTPKTCGQFVDRILSARRMVADNEMGRNRKTLINSWWLQLSKWQKLKLAEPVIWDREVGGSNPLAPTN